MPDRKWLSVVAEIHNSSLVFPMFRLGSVEYVGGPAEMNVMYGWGFNGDSPHTVWDRPKKISGHCAFGKLTVSQVNPVFDATGHEIALAVSCVHFTGGELFTARFGYALKFPSPSAVTFEKIAVAHLGGPKPIEELWDVLKNKWEGTPLQIDLWYQGKKLQSRSFTFYAGGQVIQPL